jgi:hypothetical protein
VVQSLAMQHAAMSMHWVPHCFWPPGHMQLPPTHSSPASGQSVIATQHALI